MPEEKAESEPELLNGEMSNHQAPVTKLTSQQPDGVVHTCIGKKVMPSSCKHTKLCDQNLNKSQLPANWKKMLVTS